MISCRGFWYRCRSFQDGGESNREFVSRLSFVKILVIFNARGVRIGSKSDFTSLILPFRSLAIVARIWPKLVGDLRNFKSKRR